METLFKILVSGAGTVLSFLFGAWNITLSILVIFMILDYATGIMKGAYQGKLRSDIGYKGIIKKSGIFIVVIAGNMLDLLIGDGVPVFRTMAVFFFIGNEGLSIVENLGQMGINIPKGIANKLQQLANDDEEKLSNSNTEYNSEDVNN